MDWSIGLAEKRALPDSVVRFGMRQVLRQRLKTERTKDHQAGGRLAGEFAEAMRREPIAVATRTANEQHYELPPEFFRLVLGPSLKYSSCWWPEGVETLAEAEERMLELSCVRAGIDNGMNVLDLGCGWGSLSLWIASHYPRTRVYSVSNSRDQAAFIRERAFGLGLDNVEVVTEDMNRFSTDRRFDRVVSIEMFEHMRNWERLFERISRWLVPDGRFFLHVFCHREYAYLYTDSGSSDWMARHFFTGGIMPSHDLPRRYDSDLEVEAQWQVNGMHYSRTLEAWLDNMDDQKERLMPLFTETYGDDAERWFARWRMFFMACSELFRYRGGSEWYVSHTVLKP
jgi:cyclopropane-fatty-acyl-phospholipid synthase